MLTAHCRENTIKDKTSFQQAHPNLQTEGQSWMNLRVHEWLDTWLSIQAIHIQTCPPLSSEDRVSTMSCEDSIIIILSVQDICFWGVVIAPSTPGWDPSVPRSKWEIQFYLVVANILEKPSPNTPCRRARSIFMWLVQDGITSMCVVPVALFLDPFC